MPGRAWLALCAGALALAGCARPDGGAAPRPDDRTDPALASALEDQILVDPTLSQYSNLTAVRGAETPSDAAYPHGGALVPRSACDGALAHDPAWARRLPAIFAVPDGARLRDAAGREGPGCTVQVADFTVRQRPEAVLDGYWKRARQDGYSATQLGRGGEQLIFGAKGASSYVVVARPGPGGTEVGVVVRSEG